MASRDFGPCACCEDGDPDCAGTYSIAATLNWAGGEDLDLYVARDGGAGPASVCGGTATPNPDSTRYSNNINVTTVLCPGGSGLVDAPLFGAPPETAAYTGSIHFAETRTWWAWWKQNGFNALVTPTVAAFVVTNTSVGWNILVNGGIVAPGAAATIPIGYTGRNGGFFGKDAFAIEYYYPPTVWTDPAIPGPAKVTIRCGGAAA